VSGASIDFHAIPTVPAAFGCPPPDCPVSAGAIARRWQREASRGSPAAALGSTTLYEEVALTALASVDAEQAREFVMAEPRTPHRNR
jgi:hypothetical protein